MTLGLVAIVKDAEPSIARMVESVIVAGATVATICDTGSQDRTVEIVEEHGFTVHRSPWVNFGHNRSAAFALARGTANWLLALDADMTIEIDPDFVPDPSVEAYTVEMGGSDFSYRLPLLLRGDLPWVSVGAVHEYTALPGRDYISQPTGAVRVCHPGAVASPEKLRWHVGMLEVELAEQPDNARTVFYLANSYRDLGDPRAKTLYERRATMGGFAEEAFYAAYMAATLAQEWPERLVGLLGAWQMRPSRYEPLYEAVKGLNARGQHRASWALLEQARDPEPPPDLLFVHRNVWRWGMRFERAIAAWWMDYRDEAAALNDELLAMPDLPAHIRAQTEINRAL